MDSATRAAYRAAAEAEARRLLDALTAAVQSHGGAPWTPDDEQLDKLVRVLANLPRRPDTAAPYVRILPAPTPPPIITPDLLARLVPVGPAAAWAPVLHNATTTYGLTSPLETQHFLAQVLHESARFVRLVENLSYTAGRIRAVWPRVPPDKAAALEHNPEALAEYVYGARLGNGPSGSGDGWRYRGRGLIQLTGKSNYREAGEAVGVDLVEFPELATRPDVAAATAAWFFVQSGAAAAARHDDLAGVTKAINGPALLGLEDRKRLLGEVRAAMQHVQ